MKTSHIALAAIIGVVLLFTLAACASGDDSNDADPAATPGNSATATAQAASIPPGDGPTTVPPVFDTPEPTTVPSPSDARLTADGCVADCAFSLNQSFTLALEVSDAPAPGYVLAQSMIDFGDLLLYDASQREPKDEVMWPDCEEATAVRNQFAPNLVGHGCLTGLIPPLPVSQATGTFVEIALTCSAEPSSTTVRIVPDGDPVAVTSGTMFMEADGETRSVPSVSDLTITCG